MIDNDSSFVPSKYEKAEGVGWGGGVMALNIGFKHLMKKSKFTTIKIFMMRRVGRYLLKRRFLLRLEEGQKRKIK